MSDEDSSWLETRSVVATLLVTSGGERACGDCGYDIAVIAMPVLLISPSIPTTPTTLSSARLARRYNRADEFTTTEYHASTRGYQAVKKRSCKNNTGICTACTKGMPRRMFTLRAFASQA